ncbi:MAG: hypothetical protein OEZ34_14540 [Spirochaetia bacterium]|nr:hypothetical protein [Spirochaetia bacterium]
MNWDKTIKKNKQPAVFLSAFFFCILFVLFLNDSVMELRAKELRLHLMENAYNGISLNHFSLISEYENNKNLYSKKISENLYERQAANLELVKNLEDAEDYSLVLASNFTERMSLGFVNSLRFVFGKNLIQNIAHSDYYRHLYSAYYYEKNFMFEKAIMKYDLAYSENTDPVLRAGILLHQGFCYAMLSQPVRANEAYSRVMKDYNGSEIAVTASVLQKFLYGFQVERDRLLADGAISTQRTRQLINLFAYKDALKMIEKVEKIPGQNSSELMYYKAVVLEKQGQKKDSVNLYLKVILSDKHSEYAKKANKNLFFIGKRSGDSKLVETSVQINRTLQDSELTHYINSKRFKIQELDFELESDNSEINSEDFKALEKQIEQKEKTSAETKEKVKRKVVVITASDDQISGWVESENSERLILNTSIGKITIQKSEIVKITEQK